MKRGILLLFWREYEKEEGAKEGRVAGVGGYLVLYFCLSYRERALARPLVVSVYADSSFLQDFTSVPGIL